MATSASTEDASRPSVKQQYSWLVEKAAALKNTPWWLDSKNVWNKLYVIEPKHMPSDEAFVLTEALPVGMQDATLIAYTPTSFSPANFTLTLNSCEPLRQLFREIMHSLYSGENAPPPVDPDSDAMQDSALCAAQFPDGTWHRCLIEMLNTTSCWVYSLDTGFKADIVNTCVFPLLTDLFSIFPPFVFHCIVFGVELTDLDARRCTDFCARLKSLRYTVRALFVKVCHQETTRVATLLFDPVTEENIVERYCYRNKERHVRDYVRDLEAAIVRNNVTLERLGIGFGNDEKLGEKKKKRKPKKRESSSSEDEDRFADGDIENDQAAIYDDLISFDSNPRQATGDISNEKERFAEQEELEKDGEGVIDEMYGSYGRIHSEQFSTPVFIRPHLIKKFAGLSLCSQFQRGDVVQFTAQLFEQEESSRGEESVNGDASVQAKVSASRPPRWFVVRVNVTRKSAEKMRRGVGVVTEVTRERGVITPSRTPFTSTEEELTPLIFTRRSLPRRRPRPPNSDDRVETDVDLIGEYDLDELVEAGMQVHFIADEMEAVSVEQYTPTLEHVGMVAHVSDHFGFIVFAPERKSVAEEYYRESTGREVPSFVEGVEAIRRQKRVGEFDKAVAEQFLKVFATDRIVYFERKTLRVFPAISVCGSPNGERTLEECVKERPPLRAWTGQLVRFRAVQATGAAPWRWRAVYAELFPSVGVERAMEIFAPPSSAVEKEKERGVYAEQLDVFVKELRRELEQTRDVLGREMDEWVRAAEAV